VKNRDAFAKTLEQAFANTDITVPASLFKAILSALSKRDSTANICTDGKGNPEADPELRDFENVPIKENIEDYLKREVLPYFHDAWVDSTKTKIGYEIPFTRHFYDYTPPRPLVTIESEIKTLERSIQDMLEEVLG
jgi:type I restriction enzyme M protein